MRNKKKWKQLTALLLSVSLLVPAQAVYAGEMQGAEVETYAESSDEDGFVIDENGVLTKYTGTAAEVVIPDGVTGIGWLVFDDCSELTSITIPSSVIRIGASAFRGCSGLTGITIPSSVTCLEMNVFAGCSGLESIKVEEGNPTYDSRENCNAIIEKEKMELITGCKNTTIPSSVTSLGASAFAGCSGLTSIMIPSSVASIEYGAFEGCSELTSITIPEGVTKIGVAAFNGCSGLTSKQFQKE